jgi:sirohydrochlorin ferrochelatase
MSRSLLLIDRGSREEEVEEELARLCLLIKEISSYDPVNYCFLEVVPPYIKEGISSSISDHLTIMPYFLYPGLKLKAAVLDSREIAEGLKLDYSIGDCLHYHPNLSKIVRKRVREAKIKYDIALDDRECDLLLIGHGSSDIDARNAFETIYDEIRDYYRNASYAFLELDEPNIKQGIKQLLANKPKVLIIMPYFLHKGAHVKHDIHEDIDVAIKDADCKVIITEHLGVNREMAEIVIEKARV